MGRPEFEEVSDDERRFKILNLPNKDEWIPDIPTEWLAKVNPTTRERWKMEGIVAKKIDWIMEHVVDTNNNCYLVEADVIRSRKFRQWVWVRISLIVTIITVTGNLLLPSVRDYLKEHLFGKAPSAQGGPTQGGPMQGGPTQNDPMPGGVTNAAVNQQSKSATGQRHP